MGGCCCCAAKGVERNIAPSYYYYPRASEEHVPLSPHNAATSALSTGLLVDTNLETSVPDAYRPPPAPAPFEGLGHQQTPPVAQGICSSKSDAPVQTTPDPVQEAPGDNTQETSVKCEDLKEPEYKKQTIVDLESAKEVEIELSKSVKPVVSVIEEEDVCPTCLEEYDAENPKITTKCEHHFHLACIFEWMERSDTCPVCNQEMIFDPPSD
ncbi:E3 ubiquitin-protein ligase [Melia azedarach]|uniref:E3 ubiquitin-protein ligase n=2 Tax=Melia azedarach TaxID=155640 RepID=A0ACC1XMA1_MELAZ|nr:E3 ubiquitin-protein ligase [Melia azedarach]KAJ4712043.1 E3 ubiquitin-protein ligase [Melia azedarach]